MSCELDREDLIPHGIWGIILEYPFSGGIRFVGEVDGSFRYHGTPENSDLIGLIWEIGNIGFDACIKNGLSSAPSD